FPASLSPQMFPGETERTVVQLLTVTASASSNVTGVPDFTIRFVPSSAPLGRPTTPATTIGLTAAPEEAGRSIFFGSRVHLVDTESPGDFIRNVRFPTFTDRTASASAPSV